jgi:hypothetical protein
VSRNGLPPPASDCLWRPYSSNPKRKGGTLIVEGVTDREAHQRRLRDPDGYRPRGCPGCGHEKLHVHDYPERTVLLLILVRYLCPACGATWRMLPRFAARLLWRDWPTVEAETLGPPPSLGAVRVPPRTVRRWRTRLATAAWTLVQLVLSAGVAVGGAVRMLARGATRETLVVALARDAGTPAGWRLAAAAALLHEQQPGVRLM